MKKVWIICAVAVSFAWGLVVPVMGAEQQSVEGEWRGTFASRDGTKGDLELTLKQDSEAITGTLTNSRNARLNNAPVIGTFRDNTLSLQIPCCGGAVEGAVSGNTMTGKWMGTSGNWIPFTAMRAK